MARYVDIDTSIWEDLQDFSKDAKLLYIYSFSNQAVRASGLYTISVRTILLNTGLTEKQFRGCLKELNGKLHYDFEHRAMFVPGKFKRHLSGLKNNHSVLKGVMSDLLALKKSFVSSLFVKKYWGAIGGPAAPLDIDIDIDKDFKAFEGGVGETNPAIPETKKPEEDVHRVRETPPEDKLYTEYKTRVRAGARQDAVRNMQTLFREGVTPATLLKAIDNYAKHVQEKNVEVRYRIQANNFFGEARRYTDWLEPEQQPETVEERDARILAKLKAQTR